MKPAILCVFVVLLVATGPAVAWHEENEKDSERYASQAGDPMYLEDMETCLDQARKFHQIHCTALYAHMFDPHEEEVAMNVQRPSPACVDQAWSADVLQPSVSLPKAPRFELHTTPAFVEYRGDCERPRIHPEQTLQSDIKISPNVDILGYWYLSADSLGVSGSAFSMGVLPCLTVHMRLESGPASGGSVLAEGATTRTLVSSSEGQSTGQQTPVPQPPCPNGQIPNGVVHVDEVHEIEVNLGKTKRPVDAGENFVFKVALDLDDGGDPHEEQNFGHLDWKQHGGIDHPNRIVLALQDPVRVENVLLQLFDEKIYIHTSLNSVWGSYDVDTGNVRVEIQGEDGETITDRTSTHVQDPIMGYTISPHNNLWPTNLTFPWDYKKENLDPGQYTIRVTASNWQHTATATKETTFTINQGQQECCEGPSPGDAPTDGGTDWIPTLISTLAVFVFIGVLAGAYRGPLRR